MRAEGDTITEGDLGYTERSTKVKILSELMKATNESLRDYEFLAGEIDTELLYDLSLLLSNQLLKGDGIGSNLKGIYGYAVPFDPGSFAGAVQEADKLDVLRVAINQIVVAGKGKFYPTYILMNPSDVTAMNLVKDANNNYIMPPFVADNGTRVTGVPIIQNTDITLDEYLVGDFTKAKGFVRDSLEVRMGFVDDDFAKNMVTIRGNHRVAFRIKNQDASAFVKGIFANDIAEIIKP
jgi:HK97 family phage major capsid protein